MKKSLIKNLMVFEWPGIHNYQVMSPLKAWSADFKNLGHPLKFVASTYSKGTTCFWVIQQDYENQGKKFFARLRHSPEILFDILKRADFAAEKIFHLVAKWRQNDLGKLSDSQLLQRHQELFYWDEVLWRYGQPQNLIELHNNYLTEEVKENIKKLFGKKSVNTVFTALTTANYESMLERQDKDFFLLLPQIKQVPNKYLINNRLVKKHAYKYEWMTFGWEGPALEVGYFIENITEARKNPAISKQIEKKLKEKITTLQKQEQILNKFSGKEKPLAILLNTLINAKSKRVDAHSATYFLGEKILKEIAKRTGLSLNQIRVIEPKNIKKLFKKVSVNKINQEYNLVVYWYQNGKKIKKITGAAAQKKLKSLQAGIPKIKTTNKLKGELAYPGKVKGRIKIVLYAQGFNDFKKGEILVTRITDPSYIPIMKIAKAIVTDIGGITSHAAIVAREMKKPCVIGTKYATKILKDGDMVEVDANNGTITKIK